MAYTSQIIRQATQQLDRRRTAHQSRQRALRADLYEQIPQLREIDRQLQAGMLSLTAAAFDFDRDPTERVEEIRQQNQALQAQRAQLLADQGYEAD